MTTSSQDPDLRAPMPFFGGKLRVAKVVWRRFGQVRNLVEPFCGSCAVLLGRPQPFSGTETVNDLNGWLCNFWRALQADPDAVAHCADYPVSELDLHARGDWLFYRPGVDDWIEKLRGDPEFYDAKSAGWWVWGACVCIGDGWGRRSHNARKDADGNAIAVVRSRPHLGNAGRGVNRQLPHLGDAGRGVNRQLPHLGDAGRVDPNVPPFETSSTVALKEYFRGLAERLRRVRICCGDWTRVLGPTPTVKMGLTAVFLDPPYAVVDRDSVYGEHEDRNVAHEVREWAIAHGDDPMMRIALCGYDEHDVAMPDSWDCVAWKATGGYGVRSIRGTANAKRERIWFSPHCISRKERMLF